MAEIAEPHRRVQVNETGAAREGKSEHEAEDDFMSCDYSCQAEHLSGDQFKINLAHTVSNSRFQHGRGPDSLAMKAGLSLGLRYYGRQANKHGYTRCWKLGEDGIVAFMNSHKWRLL